jgi:hypothetical protein
VNAIGGLLIMIRRRLVQVRGSLIRVGQRLIGIRPPLIGIARRLVGARQQALVSSQVIDCVWPPRDVWAAVSPACGQPS